MSIPHDGTCARRARARIIHKYCRNTPHRTGRLLKKKLVKKFGQKLKKNKSWICSQLTPVAGSIFGPLSQTLFSKIDFKNCHISRFFQVIQVILSGKFSSAEEVDLSFIS